MKASQDHEPQPGLSSKRMTFSELTLLDLGLLVCTLETIGALASQKVCEKNEEINGIMRRKEEILESLDVK